MKNLTLLIALLLVAGSLFAQQTEKRLALVIGNSAYQHGGKLKNPVNDADLLVKTLESMNFTVIKKTDASLREMQMATADFTKKIKDYKVALFFYAGHGVQIEGENFLIPVDAKMDSREMAKFDAFNISFVNDAFQQNSKNINIMILDACRNDPFRSWGRGGERGFKKIDNSSSGTIIAFATQPGSTADDGTGSNGLYTSHLVKQMQINQDIEDVFKKTRIAVSKASSGKQVPQDWSSLMGDFYFTKAGSNTENNNSPEESTWGDEEEVYSYGNIDIKTEITGDFYLDGKRKGKLNANTRKPLNSVTTGNHTYKIIGENETKTGTITVYKDQTATITITSTKPQKTAGTTYTNNKAGLTMIWAGGGSFQMGSNSSDAYDDEKPVHTVNLSNFSLSKTEVTNSQYCKFLNQKGNQTEGGATWLDITDEDCLIEKSGGTFYPKSGKGNHPVIEVTWYGAKAYCKWAGGRLPTEAEWQFAAKANNNYKYAGSNNIDEVAWYKDNSGGKTHSVAQKKANAFGLYDMSGNVREWTEDKWHANYTGAPTDGSAWTSGSGSGRVCCGGGWSDTARYSRSSVRSNSTPDGGYFNVGFRLCQ